MRPFLVGCALLLAGCVSTVPTTAPVAEDRTATYWDAATGHMLYCEDPGWTAIYRGGIIAHSAYADCKTNAEAKGYVRWH